MEKKILDKLDSFDFSLQQKRMLVEVIKDIISSTKSDTPVAQSDPLIPLFEAAGATYVPETDTYTVNDIKGITKDEICDIYFNATNNYSGFKGNAVPRKNVKTNFVKNKGDQLQEGTFKYAGVEALRINEYSQTTLDRDVSYAFSNAKCKKILDLLMCTSGATGLDTAFKGCTNLESFQLFNVTSDVFLGDSPNVTAESIKSIVDGGYGLADKPVTITVHQSVFDKINSATGEWAGVLTSATSKHITFAV